MKRHTLKFGIISREAYRKRTLAIARGEYKPKVGEPKVWFESLRSMSEVLSNDNQALLELILTEKPQSLTELEIISGRNKGNLSRTLKTLERYGIVQLKKIDHRLVPEVMATNFTVEFGINAIG